MNGNGKGKERMEEDAVGQPNGLNEGIPSMTERGRLVDESLACRYLVAQCLVGPPDSTPG